MFTPIWLHFGILGPFCVFGRVLARRREKTPKCLDFGDPLGSLRAPFFTKNRFVFRSKNASLFWSIFHALWASFSLHLGVHFASKNLPGRKKAILSKWAARLSECSIFEGRDPQNPSKKHPRMHPKNDHFLRGKTDEKNFKKGSQNDPKLAPESVPKPPWKNDQKIGGKRGPQEPVLVREREAR